MKKIFLNSVVSCDMEEIFEGNVDWACLNECTILITGATGMLASYMTYFLIFLNKMKNINVKIIAQIRNKEKAKKVFFDLFNEKCINFVNFDLLDEVNLDESIDYIIHAASLASPQYYTTCPVEVAEPNAIGTYNLLKFAEKKKVKGFLLFSTGDIYGDVRGEQKVFEETMGYADPLYIHSCYNESKRMAETWCKTFFYEKKVPTKIARIWHTYSPTMDIENDPRVFASFVKCVIDNKNIEMLSEGRQTRTFCYITDAIVGFFLILFSGKDGEAYNICNTEECYSIREIAEIVQKNSIKSDTVVVCKKRNKNDVYLENKTYGDMVPQNSKLKELGWNCKVNCNMGFSRVIKKFREDEKNENII
ncbi:MAG: NAD-dependent epimerase/dehydratase family protein [Lachnospiraceae bacterium]|nr:NAD-dependent epimerase/dehydratase family protein [Lachnospiraceae bacterium]